MEVYFNQEVEEFKKLASDFCKKSLSKFLDEKNPDGNFELMDPLYNQACSIGIVALPDTHSQGYEYGVWGKQTTVALTALHNSLAILETLAQACATFAYRVHIQGIATNALIQGNVDEPSSSTMVSLHTAPFPPTIAALHNPSLYTSSCTLSPPHPDNVLTGEISVAFGYNPDSLLVLLPYDATWILTLCKNTTTLNIAPLRTHGLRGVAHKVIFNNTSVEHVATLNKSAIQTLFAFMWLGIAAIACGIAQSAYIKAFNYAHQRYQRGCIIKNIESVQMLLGSSKANIETARHALFSFDLCDSYSLLKQAARSKLTATTLCSQAVTDCLQVFGGYGYMEDFGIEKKFRDINTLTTIGGSPFFMKQFIAQMEMEE